jgi:hypothetical protein
VNVSPARAILFLEALSLALSEDNRPARKIFTRLNGIFAHVKTWRREDHQSMVSPHLS